MNSDEARSLWNSKYEEGLPSLTEPDPFFVSAYTKSVDSSFRNGGSGLDLAGGIGRHALWLATRKWQVSVVDISPVAIEKLGKTADKLGVKLKLFAIGAEEYKFQPAAFDLIVLFYHLDRGLFPKIVSALKPGGLFICKMAVLWNSQNEETTTDHAPLQRDEFVSLASGLRIIHHNERPVKNRGVVEFVGMKAELESASFAADR